jgi:hypothetical protein
MDVKGRRQRGQTRLAIEQNLDALSHGGFGLCPQDLVAVVTDRVGNHRKPIPGEARHLGHDLRRLCEPIGDNRRGSDPSFLGGDGVMQTA